MRNKNRLKRTIKSKLTNFIRALKKIDMLRSGTCIYEKAKFLTQEIKLPNSPKFNNFY